MGAIFGYSGTSQKTADRMMGRALSHRGKGALTSDYSPHGVIHCLPNGNKGLHCDGLVRENGVVLALVGRLYGNDSQKDLSQLIRLYRKKGIDFVRDLRGDFVLVVRDRERIYLARDRAGARTVYYGTQGKRFVFAVEPKGVYSFPGFSRSIRPAAVAQYLTFSFVPGASTMLENLWELPPGHTVCVHAGTPEKPKRFFFFEELSKEKRHHEQWVEEFISIHRNAVSERRPENGNIGIFLSGGLDSSAVAAEVCAMMGRPVPAYSIHFGEEYPHELEFARATAKRVGAEHREILIQPQEFLPRLRRMVHFLDEPIGDPVTMPNYELSAIAAKDVEYIYNGEGGDPLFGGPKNIPMLLQHWYGGVERDEFFRERAYLSSYRRAYHDLDDLLTPEWRAQYDSQQALEGLLTPFFQSPHPQNFLDKLCAINIRLKGAHLILPKVERMTGAHGITPLSPLFDERLIELSFRMPSTMKLAKGVEKVIIKDAYRDQLPSSVIERPKSGMRVPVHYWFKKDLKKYAKKILSKNNIRRVGIFEPDQVKALLDYDLEIGQARYGLKLWMLIMFELWRRIVVEGETV